MKLEVRLAGFAYMHMDTHMHMCMHMQLRHPACACAYNTFCQALKASSGLEERPSQRGHLSHVELQGQLETSRTYAKGELLIDGPELADRVLGVAHVTGTFSVIIDTEIFTDPVGPPVSYSGAAAV